MQENDVKNTQAEENVAPEAEVKQEPVAQEEATAQQNAEEAAGDAAKEAEPDPRDAKIEELTNRLLRLQADFENFRRRSAGEKEQLSTFVTAGVVGKFLKVLDNFERAEASAAKATDMEGVITGMQKIRRQFEDAFKELRVEEIPAQNKKFDPKLHEAVMRGQNPELEDETIDMVLEKGYRLGDKVIRHSKVRVINND
ncbi:MAG: nucleotide exchange factor GrpE [Phascolarctobacterium sp.]|uniref:nucleotide exchange factor GrpE n=1 Tax=Phascolarctobacterium sp. TaxID=2049039 RepID=UPI0026DC623A|nr:nucleotide exchange factor GrpE [Phascolarctobacterium sp.]MDO4922092.1 nucleotide exchange factor GrpE [Phascolarctobacterium sp.]